MRRDAIAVGIVFILLGSLGAYMMLSTENNVESDNQIEDDQDGLSDEWDVYYVQTGDELPICDSDTLGRLYYVASHSGFETCTTTGWMFVDLRGPAGVDGTNGTDGVDGADGADGVDGSASTNTMLTSISETNPEDCFLGGRVVSEGLDNGDMDLTAYAEDFTVGDTGLNLTIPDGDVIGLNSTIDLTNVDGLVDQMEIFVNISHNYIGDLIITLTTPNGEELVLRENEGGADNDIVEWVPVSGYWGPVSGEWILNIEDVYNSDVGVLNSWLIRHTNTTVVSYPANGVLEVEEADYITTYCRKYVGKLLADVTLFQDDDLVDFTGVVDSDGDPISPVVYFGGGDDRGLMAFNPLNGTVWETNSTVKGAADVAQHGKSQIFYRGYANQNSWGTPIDCGLYVYDIGPGTTQRVAEVCPEDIYAHTVSPWYYTRVWFRADSEYGEELWCYYEGNETAWMVADINPGPGNSMPINFQAAGDLLQVYFTAKDDAGVMQLWSASGSNWSVWKVADTNMGGYGGFVWSADHPDMLFFESEQIIQYDSSTGDPILQNQIWVYNIEDNSAQMVTETAGPLSVDQLFITSNRIYFGQGIGSLWTYDLMSENGSAWSLNCTSSFSQAMVVGDLIFFGEISGYSGGLQVYDETSDVCAMVDFGYEDVAPRSLAEVNGELYFSGESEFGRELFTVEIEETISFEIVS